MKRSLTASFFAGWIGKSPQVDRSPAIAFSQVSVFYDPDHSGELFFGQRLQNDGVEMRHVEIAVRFDVGGLRDDRNMREPGIILHCGGKFGAVHLRHPDIGEDQVDRLLFEEFQRRPSGLGREDITESDLVEKCLGDAAVQLHVVDNENAGLLQVADRDCRCRFGLGFPDRLDCLRTVTHGVESHGEGASLSDFAGAGQLAVHAHGQPFGDGEPETRAVVHGIGAAQAGKLDERFHELLLVFLGNADAGIGDGAAERSGVRGTGIGGKGDMERDGPVLRELDGVAEQVDQDLADADVVDLEFREVLRHIGD